MIFAAVQSESYEKARRPREHVASFPSEVQSSVASFDLPVSPVATILTFVLGDLIGILSVVGTTFLLASWLVPASAQLVYGQTFWVIGATLLVYSLAGLYRRRFTHPAIEMQRIGLLSLLGGALTAGAVFASTGSVHTSGLLLFGGILAAVVMPVCRALFRILFARTSWWGFPAVILNSGDERCDIYETLRRWPEIGLRPVALVNESSSKEKDPDGIIRGSHGMVPYLAERFDIPYAVLAMPHLSHDQRAKLLSKYSKFFDHVFVVGDSGGSPALWTAGQCGDGLLGYGVQHVTRQPAARFIKRTVDLVGALLGLILLAPVFVLIAVLVRMDSPGSVFFRQERMGREGRIINIVKFRTMYEDADEKLEALLEENAGLRREYEKYHKLKEDPRVTPVGRILRRYSLDELPQILNVLWGEMSLVGPRAYLPSELKKMNGLARSVLQSRPGITGLWQVSGRNHLSFTQRVRLDVHYIQNWSPWLDLYLLVRTVPVVFSGEGAA